MKSRRIYSERILQASLYKTPCTSQAGGSGAREMNRKALRLRPRAWRGVLVYLPQVRGDVLPPRGGLVVPLIGRGIKYDVW